MNTVSIENKIEAFLANLNVPTNDFQKEFWNQLLEAEFPTTKQEYWKYTRLGKIANHAFHLNLGSSHVNITKEIIAKDYLVVVNGMIREDLSQFDKSKFHIQFNTPNEDLNKLIQHNDVFSLLNGATIVKSIDIELAANVITNDPLQIIFVGEGKNVLQSSLLNIRTGKSSEGEIILTFVTRDGDQTLTNFYSNINVGENGSFTIHKFQVENNTALHIATDNITQAKSSRFTINTNSFNGKLLRNNLNISVDDQNCETNLNGIVMGHGENHVDNHTFVSHEKSNCVSNENYKYVLDDKSVGVFNGRVIVQKDAQQINAFQSNGNVLLSDFASINSKPELEIYADDVKCSHGSTTGQLDEAAIFYLQSRGISKSKAQKMLVSAFIAEVIENYKNEAVRDYLFAYLETHFGWEF